jgi:hypothetical protein
MEKAGAAGLLPRRDARTKGRWPLRMKEGAALQMGFYQWQHVGTALAGAVPPEEP